VALSRSSMSAPALSVHVGKPQPMHALRLVPGIALATVVGIASLLVATVETRAFGHPIIEGLVVAILLGMAIGTLWVPPLWIEVGVRFTATRVLEAAVFLLGASVDVPLLVRAGPALALGIVLLVVLGISCSYGIGRAVGLPHKLAVLVACGNSICGNSAIAAIAPVIHAEKEHVASSIAFTAILGVVVVIGLPFLIQPLSLSFYQYGVLAGLTVYAVPQVLAAAFPVSVLSGQVGTLVKLVRVLMLGPVVLFFALAHRNDPAARGARVPGFQLTRFVPWFIIGFYLPVERSDSLWRCRRDEECLDVAHGGVDGGARARRGSQGDHESRSPRDHHGDGIAPRADRARRNLDQDALDSVTLAAALSSRVPASAEKSRASCRAARA